MSLRFGEMVLCMLFSLMVELQYYSEGFMHIKVFLGYKQSGNRRTIETISRNQELSDSQKWIQKNKSLYF